MLTVQFTTRFKKDLKAIKKRNLNLDALEDIVELLVNEKELPAKNRDHELTGNWNGHRECHIQPDWLLIYKVEGNTLMLYRTGSHSDLF